MDVPFHQSISVGLEFRIFPENVEWVYLLEDGFYPKERFFTKKGGKTLEEYFFMIHGTPMSEE